jgi:hypothetical protein
VPFLNQLVAGVDQQLEVGIEVGGVHRGWVGLAHRDSCDGHSVPFVVLAASPRTFALIGSQAGGDIDNGVPCRQEQTGQCEAVALAALASDLLSAGAGDSVNEFDELIGCRAGFLRGDASPVLVNVCCHVGCGYVDRCRLLGVSSCSFRS